MKKLLFPIVFALIGLVGGLVGGQFLHTPPPTELADGAKEGDREVASDAEKDQIERSLAGYEQPQKAVRPSVEDEGVVYHKMDKPFVIPVVENSRVKTLMVMSIALRISTGSGEIVFEHEPKLRDEFLQALFIHGQSNGFDSIYQKPHVLADLRASLLQSAKIVLGDIVTEVLLTNIVRKDV